MLGSLTLECFGTGFRCERGTAERCCTFVRVLPALTIQIQTTIILGIVRVRHVVKDYSYLYDVDLLRLS